MVQPRLRGISSKAGLILVFALLCCPCVSAEVIRNVEVKMFSDLESESPEVRKAASYEILDNWRTESRKVAELVEKYVTLENRKGTAKDMILLLGKLRAAEYTPILVQHMTFEVYYKETKRPQTTEDLYPAVQALIDMGSPALNAVLERLKSENSGIVARTGAAVLQGILGEQWASAVLDSEIQNSDQIQVKERLQRVLHQLQNLP